jgi:hypothetical protein
MYTCSIQERRNMSPTQPKQKPHRTSKTLNTQKPTKHDRTPYHPMQPLLS